METLNGAKAANMAQTSFAFLADVPVGPTWHVCPLCGAHICHENNWREAIAVHLGRHGDFFMEISWLDTVFRKESQIDAEIIHPLADYGPCFPEIDGRNLSFNRSRAPRKFSHVETFDLPEI
jgi:hypothetical protein